MNDREFKEQMKRVNKLVDVWYARLGRAINGHKITYTWGRDPKTGDAEGHKTCAATRTLWQYLDSTITFYLPSCALLADEDLEEIVVHEYMHIICGPMAPDEAMPCEELVATQLARAMIRCYKIGTKDGVASSRAKT